MNETNRRLRGHDFLPPWEQLTEIPQLYETEAVQMEKKLLHLHYFIGGCDWYVAEIDDDEWLAFGYANLNDPVNAEWPVDERRALGHEPRLTSGQNGASDFAACVPILALDIEGAAVVLEHGGEVGDLWLVNLLQEQQVEISTSDQVDHGRAITSASPAGVQIPGGHPHRIGPGAWVLFFSGVADLNFCSLSDARVESLGPCAAA